MIIHVNGICFCESPLVRLLVKVGGEINSVGVWTGREDLIDGGFDGGAYCADESHMVLSIARFAEMSSRSCRVFAAYRFQSRVYIFGGVGLWTVVCLYCNT